MDTPLNYVLTTLSTAIAEIAPVHCLGMTNRQVNAHLRDVLAVVGDQFGITEFEPPIRMEPIECPLSDCPLKVA